jgi:hypothetical protein
VTEYAQVAGLGVRPQLPIAAAPDEISSAIPVAAFDLSVTIVGRLTLESIASLKFTIRVPNPIWTGCKSSTALAAGAAQSSDYVAFCLCFR